MITKKVARKPPALRLAFVVNRFPILSETFIINQIADLIDRNVQIDIFAFAKGDCAYVSSRFTAYRMDKWTSYLGIPSPRYRRLLGAVPRAWRLLTKKPSALFRALNIVKYGREAWSLRLLYQVAPFVGKTFDIIHCHFGTAATQFFTIKDILQQTGPIVVTFYGHDASRVFRQSPRDFYDRVKTECALFLVMSNNMKERLVAQGFGPEKVKVHPVSIDVKCYPFVERRYDPAQPVELVSVGRFVEKKGFDDLLRSLAVVKQLTRRRFTCSIVGDGPLNTKLRELSSSLGLDGIVSFEGFMKIDDLIPFLTKKHILVQPSKIAPNGDME